MFKAIESVFSFLTIIPFRGSDLETLAKNMYWFPIIGMIIGLLIGSLGFGISIFLDPLIVALIVTGSILLVTGLHHTDALGDFSDGLMVKGNFEKKMQVMKDPALGSAGIASISLYIISLVVSISLMSGYVLFQALIISEIIAKFSMVILAAFGKSAWKGSNQPFLTLMKDKKRFFIAILFTVVPISLIGGWEGILVLSVGVILSFIILKISEKNFGGISGDVLGAANEITRLSSLIMFSAL